MGAHHKEVNPVENGFLLRTKQQLATLGAVDDQDDVVLLAEAGDCLQREDSPTLAGHLCRECQMTSPGRFFSPGHRAEQRILEEHKHLPTTL